MISHEAILHYVWKFKLFNNLHLQTEDGDDVQILSVGSHNLDAGPDFYNAKIKIGNTIWVGNVEIHIKSSDWQRHQHQKDKAYDNVILHVVWENDAPIYRTDNTIIPTLLLKNRVDSKIITSYDQLKYNSYWIPCEPQLAGVDDFTKQQCLDRMCLERLEEKSQIISELYQQLKGNWEDTFYITMAKSFGFKVNSLPFELLANNLSQLILAKHKDQSLQIEALIFGVAGLLNRTFIDDYPNSLKKEYQFLKAKYGFNEVGAELWKFSKTRPDNFPTIRIAQFAALVLSVHHLFSKIIAVNVLNDFNLFFENLPIHHYWKTHFVFDKKVDVKSINLGSLSIDSLLINALVPLMFFYGKQNGNSFYTDQAIKLLEFVKPEQNVITKGFELRGLKAKQAFDSQGLIQLKKYYCNHKKCLNCGIGLKILKT
jgi:hypothetical protein